MNQAGVPVSPVGGGRLLVITGSLGYNVVRNIIDLDRQVPGLQWLVLVHAPRKSIGDLLRNQRLNLRRNGWRWIPYQVVNILGRLRRASPARPQEGAPGAEYTLDALQSAGRLRIERVPDLHGEPCLDAVRAFAPDLGLSLGPPILRPSLFEIPRMGTINLHKGRLPDYRGMPPAFWELWTDQAAVGCSVHMVTSKLDAGAVLACDQVPRHRYSDVRGLQIRLDELGAQLVCRVAVQLLTGQAHPQPQPEGAGHTYRKPTLAQQAELARRLAERHPKPGVPWKEFVKSMLGRAVFAAHELLLWRVLRPRVTVLLFHRVSDDARDNLTVGVAQFEHMMALLATHCQVLSIEQVLAMQTVPRSRRPLVAITFDDGYEDNFSNAAPSLRRYGLPAAFFVSTGIVNSVKPFPHDIKRGNGALPVMQWQQLRQLRDWAFTIGSHTVNHIDCVAEPEPTVVHELAQSSADLQRELGLAAPIFAYPYGGRHQMNAERLELVKAAGYSACLSAYGGTNVGCVDRWEVLRRGVHWEFSPASFLRYCVGY